MKKLITVKIASLIFLVGTIIAMWWFASPIYNSSPEAYATIVKGGTILGCVIYTFVASIIMWKFSTIKFTQ